MLRTAFVTFLTFLLINAFQVPYPFLTEDGQGTAPKAVYGSQDWNNEPPSSAGSSEFSSVDRPSQLPNDISPRSPRSPRVSAYSQAAPYETSKERYPPIPPFYATQSTPPIGIFNGVLSLPPYLYGSLPNNGAYGSLLSPSPYYGMPYSGYIPLLPASYYGLPQNSIYESLPPPPYYGEYGLYNLYRPYEFRFGGPIYQPNYGFISEADLAFAALMNRASTWPLTLNPGQYTGVGLRGYYP